MNRRVNLRRVEELLQQVNDKMLYTVPMCKVIKIESEGLICSSVTGSETGNRQQQWEEEEIEEGGENEL